MVFGDNNRENSPTTRLLTMALSSHLSNQKDRLLFLLATHLEPHLKTSLAFATADQVLEHIWPRKPLVEFLLQVYFWARTWAHNELLSLWNLQLSFASKALFLGSMAKSPRPSSFLGLVIFLQLIRWSFFLLSVEPQKKFRLSLSTALAIFRGGSVHCMI